MITFLHVCWSVSVTFLLIVLKGFSKSYWFDNTGGIPYYWKMRWSWPQHIGAAAAIWTLSSKEISQPSTESSSVNIYQWMICMKWKTWYICNYVNCLCFPLILLMTCSVLWGGNLYFCFYWMRNAMTDKCVYIHFWF